MDAGKGCRQQDGKVRDTEGGASALLLAIPTPSNPKAWAEDPTSINRPLVVAIRLISGSRPQREDSG